MKKSLVIMAVLAIAATCAQAGMLTVPLTSQFGGTAQMKIYYDGTATVLGLTYDRFHVTITAATVDPINAVDLKVTPVGTSGANWLLNLRAFDWINGVGNVNTQDLTKHTSPPAPDGPPYYNGGEWLHSSSVPVDTHFDVSLWGPANIVASEGYYGGGASNLGTLTFDDTGELWGDFTTEAGKKGNLLQANAVVNAPSGATYDILNIVVRANQSAKIESLSGQKWFGTGGAGHAFAPGSASITFDNTIPEPATLVLIALGGLGLLSRRRR